MDNNKGRIEDLKSKIGANNIDLKQIYQSAGERATIPEVFSGDSEKILSLLQKISSLNKDLAESDIQINDLRNSFKRIAEITDREQEIGELYSNLEKENRKLFLPIGKAVFLEWKDNPSDDFSKLMKNLNEQDTKVVSLDNEIYQLTNSAVKKNILQILKNKSRVVVLNSKKKSCLSTMNTLYKKTGEKVFKKDISYFENLNNESVFSFIANRKELKKLDEEILELKEENLRLEKHLKSKFSSSKQKKAEEKLQSERDLLMSEKMAVLNDLGSQMYAEKLDFGDKEIQSLFKSAEEIHEKNNLLDKEIEVCNAELEIEKLDEEVLDMKKNIKELELTIEKCTGDIAEFNKEIKRARTEIRKLKKLTEESAE